MDEMQGNGLWDGERFQGVGYGSGEKSGKRDKQCVFELGAGVDSLYLNSTLALAVCLGMKGSTELEPGSPSFLQAFPKTRRETEILAYRKKMGRIGQTIHNNPDGIMSLLSLWDKIICDLDKTPELSQRSPQNCPKYGHLVNGHYCQGCALLRKKFKEDLFTSGIEHGILQDSFEPSNVNLNVANALQEPFVGNQDPSKNSSQTPPQINHHWCYGCGNPLEDEFIKSSVENLVPNLSESEGENECDMPVCEAFTTFLNILFDVEYDFYSSDDQSFSDEIDSLFDEFAGELTLLKSIPPGTDETDCDPEEETHFIKRLLYDNSSPHPLEEFVFENSDAEIESFSPSPIPVEDSDSLIEEISLSFTPDYPMPPGIKEDDYDSQRDILILEELLSNDSLSLPKNESFHFDIPSFSRPLAKPPDEKSPDLLSHMGLEAFQPSVECPMMFHGKNTPILDVPLFHFYPP
uniref:Uncharacterized protein n=1 Tax=Tanacetum cinerariifolium TaxID=118510 RepID=A0A6L2JZC9_TANCI|nr:hypothetical protein [Tanacetum cinerariifolium]